MQSLKASPSVILLLTALFTLLDEAPRVGESPGREERVIQ